MLSARAVQQRQVTLQWVSAVNQHIQEGGSRYTLLPFKLHQFIAQTGSVYTTLDQGEERFITLEPGIYKHDDSNKKPIFANVFSRATGHPFICVSLAGSHLVPREFRAYGDDDQDATDGYLIIGDEIWDPDEDLDYLPEAWVRTRASGEKVPDSRKRAHFPRKLYFDEYGNCSETEPMSYWGWFMQAPLLFDPTGGVFYDAKTNEGTKHLDDHHGLFDPQPPVGRRAFPARPEAPELHRQPARCSAPGRPLQ